MKKLLTSIVAVAGMLTSPPSLRPSGAAEGTAYNFDFPGIDGGTIRLADWRGKVILVVNTASFCGYTKQYAGLQQLWSTYESQGLVVLGVPSNDFGGQEPKAEGEIKKFCEGAFGVTFPLAAKQTVIGDGAHPFYAWAARVAGSGGVPKWNFHKYLIGRDGGMLMSFNATVAPQSPELRGAIETALAERPAP